MIGDGVGSVGDVLKAAAASAGVKSVAISGFVRFKAGEFDAPKVTEATA